METNDQRTLTFLPGLEDSALPRNGLDSAPSPTPKLTLMQAASCGTTGRPYPTSETLQKSTEILLKALTSLRQACLANLQATPVDGVDLLTIDGCGRIPCESSANFNLASVSLRTHQQSLLSKPGEPSTELCQSFTPSAMLCGGKLYPLPPLVQGISANDCSLLLPTPQASDVRDRGNVGNPVVQRRMLLGKQVNLGMLFKGAPCPFCVLGMMGFPKRWLNPLYDAWATPSSRKSPTAS